ncbi:MAG: hypothetical protein IJ486_06595 [Firmicutes bacterium]|nr:hypothetical protein [Bacillota bacterium]
MFDKNRQNSSVKAFNSVGGYILIYVMVVVMTLCILAASICTSAVRNLKVQQNSIEHMKFVYEAEGIGERFVSEFQKAVQEGEVSYTKTIENPNVDSKHSSALETIVQEAIDEAKTNASLDPEGKDITIVNADDEEFIRNNIIYEGETVGKFTIQLCIIAGDSELDTEIQWKMSVAMEETRNEGILMSCKYYIDDIDSPVYNSYEIKAVNTTELEGGTE